MASVALRPVRVAILSESERQRIGLKRVLEQQGLEVVFHGFLGERSSGELDAGIVDVLVIDLEGAADSALDAMDRLIEGSTLPMLFNDRVVDHGQVRRGRTWWGRHMVAKLISLAETPRGTPVSSPLAHDGTAARQVWVLGASIGGPEAVRRFLDALPGDLPVALVLAQHIGESFVPLLAEQLQRVTRLAVRVAEEGRALCEGELVVVPVGRHFMLDSHGCIRLPPLESEERFSPSIDAVMLEVARHYGDRAGAILFSGMGGDGVAGARAIEKKGGPVWVQDPETCVVSAMVDGACEAGIVSFDGAPEALAVVMAARFT